MIGSMNVLGPRGFETPKWREVTCVKGLRSENADVCDSAPTFGYQLRSKVKNEEFLPPPPIPPPPPLPPPPPSLVTQEVAFSHSLQFAHPDH
ncbi:unnamed protein product [Hymenolepis diminuta]|uniref:Uncharacterized protein n=1 Tax=Hymenolepis diminuta TaxID=6216 RepID=A0A564Z0G1_HYMDI|nr:unnamed protein product [Hymenolepis diminuta]